MKFTSPGANGESRTQSGFEFRAVKLTVTTFFTLLLVFLSNRKSTVADKKKRVFDTMAPITPSEVEKAAPDGAEGGTSVQLKDEHNEAFAGTLTKLSVEKTKNDHCNRLRRMIECMKTEYPKEANECIFKLTEDQMSDPFLCLHHMHPFGFFFVDGWVAAMY